MLEDLSEKEKDLLDTQLGDIDEYLAYKDHTTANTFDFVVSSISKEKGKVICNITVSDLGEEVIHKFMDSFTKDKKLKARLYV